MWSIPGRMKMSMELMGRPLALWRLASTTGFVVVGLNFAVWRSAVAVAILEGAD